MVGHMFNYISGNLDLSGFFCNHSDNQQYIERANAHMNSYQFAQKHSLEAPTDVLYGQSLDI